MEKPGLELDDETEKIFLTPDGTAEDISKEMKDFMAYVTDKKTDSDFARRLDDAVKAIKSVEGWRIEYMQLKEKMDENFKAGEIVGEKRGEKIGEKRGEKIGEERGQKKRAIETAISFLSLGKNTKEEIAECTGLSLKEVNELAKKSV